MIMFQKVKKQHIQCWYCA